MATADSSDSSGLTTILDTGPISNATWERFDADMEKLVKMVVKIKRSIVTLTSLDGATRTKMRTQIIKAVDLPEHKRTAITDERLLGPAQWRLQFNNGSVIMIKKGE